MRYYENVLFDDEIYCAAELSQHIKPLLSQLKSIQVSTVRLPEVYVTNYLARTVVFVLKDKKLLISHALVLTSGLVCCYFGMYKMRCVHCTWRILYIVCC